MPHAQCPMPHHWKSSLISAHKVSLTPMLAIGLTTGLYAIGAQNSLEVKEYKGRTTDE
ncbi:hypothetical protein IQ246_21915 [aff. Roholtiella sp. LEGE 12411]|uniref:hypothetical protein n=2 Tax=aff. Roholtiella sp. LEGE 12411 TaxID=1828822 RepID=UPI00187F9F5F|nr:hypothetical protein [aff. Roholtiella sp. LEGE 12411]MBE9037715.1 hypothetical protein [aff. Roholtiella sp. LEGE 12411]